MNIFDKVDEGTYVRATDITDYLFCPRRVYLKRILRINEPPTKEKIIGSLIHETLENLNDIENKIIFEKLKDFIEYNDLLKTYFDFIDEIFREVFYKYKSIINELKLDEKDISIIVKNNIKREVENRARYLYNYMVENDVYGIELAYSIDPKVMSEVDIVSEKYKLKGKIDRLEIYRNKKIIIPYEIKSGNFNRDHKIQLYVYYLMLKDNYKDYYINRGYIIYTRDDKLYEVRFNGSDRKEIIKNILQVRDKILEILAEHKDPGISKNLDKCSKCNLYKFCYRK